MHKAVAILSDQLSIAAFLPCNPILSPLLAIGGRKG